MRKIYFFIAAALIFCAAIQGNAQIKVRANGTVRVGSFFAEDDGTVEEELLDSITPLQVFEMPQLNSTARITFGLQLNTSQFPLNVAIGRHDYIRNPGNQNRQKLWLHGRNGFCFTRGNAALDTVFRFNQEGGPVFEFTYPVKSEGILLTSDERYKQDISDFSGALETLAELRGVTYHYKPRQSPEKEAYSQITDPEARKYYDEFDKEYAAMEAARASKLRYGFIAQEVEQVLPELVEHDPEGMMSMDYIALIPILVNAVNELSAKNAELERIMGLSETSYAPRQEVSGIDNILTDKAAEVLSQNDPNPFSNDTQIAYNLPVGTQTAAIYIYDLQGKQVSCLPVTDMGAGCVTLHGGDLQAGMYIYSLIANGKELASKKMILTK